VFDLQGAATTVVEVGGKCYKRYLLDNKFVSPDSAQRLPEEWEVGLPWPNLPRIARDGYVVKDPGLRAYFRGKQWYKARIAPVVLTKIEKANVDLIRSFV
jgi:hypothetical protein